MKVFISYFLSVFLISYCFTACQNVKDSRFLNERVIRKGVNEQFELKFEACHSCGYIWILESVDTTTIKLLGKSSEPKSHDPNLVGGNAIETWTFIGLQKGSYQLVFNYKRPWLEEIQKTEKIKLIVEQQNRSSTGTSSITIMVPENDSAYKEKMTQFVQEGGENPLITTTFITKEITIPYTRDIIKASAQAAAEDIYPASASAGGPGVDSMAYFKIRDDTAYILLNMDIDGWAGVSVAIAIVHPVVERTLLQFPEIKHVVFDSIP